MSRVSVIFHGRYTSGDDFMQIKDAAYKSAITRGTNKLRLRRVLGRQSSSLGFLSRDPSREY